MKTERVRFTGKNRKGFFLDLKTAVNQYFEEKGISQKANTEMVVKTIVLFAITYGAYGVILSESVPKWAMLVLAGVMGLGIAGIGFSVAHDAMHGAYSSKGWVNRLLGLSMDLGGSNSYVWDIKHNKAHHTYTNIQDFDEDIRGAKLVRFSPHGPHYPINRYQHLYAFFLYSLVYFNIVFVYNFQQFAAKDFGPFKGLKHKRAEITKLIFWKLFYIFYVIVIPLWVMDISVGEFLLGFALMNACAGYALGLIFNLAHLVEDLDFPLPEEGNIEEAWAVHQMRTTANFAMRNRFLTWYVGGLNYQIEHHLFPWICSVHYPAISHIIQEKAKEYGVPYHAHKSFWGSLASHYRMLKRLAKKEPAERFQVPKLEPVG